MCQSERESYHEIWYRVALLVCVKVKISKIKQTRKKTAKNKPEHIFIFISMRFCRRFTLSVGCDSGAATKSQTCFDFFLSAQKHHSGGQKRMKIESFIMSYTHTTTPTLIRHCIRKYSGCVCVSARAHSIVAALLYTTKNFRIEKNLGWDLKRLFTFSFVEDKKARREEIVNGGKRRVIWNRNACGDSERSSGKKFEFSVKILSFCGGKFSQKLFVEYSSKFDFMFEILNLTQGSNLFIRNSFHSSRRKLKHFFPFILHNIY